MKDKIQQQVDKNYEAFTKQLPELLASHAGQFALMRDGEIIGFFDTARDAYLAGQKLYDDGLFSVQEIIKTPVELGYFSHAVSHG
jgi:hypothetical protein